MDAHTLFMAGEQAVIDNDSTTRFQSLPVEFQIDQSSYAKIRSYINNLHQEHFAPLYDSIALILERFVPLFDRVLLDLIK